MSKFIHLVVRKKTQPGEPRQYNNREFTDSRFMQYTDWENCYVAGGHLARTRFVNADFRGSNMKNATIHFLDLTGADLSGVKMSTGTRFVGCTLTDVKWPANCKARFESCWDANEPELVY